MTLIEVIQKIIAGGLLGVLGQGIRTVVGLKKLHSENLLKSDKKDHEKNISGARLILSMFIGFVAGALGMLVKGSSNGKVDEYDTELIVTIIAVGYSGADFIEGVFNTYLTKFTGTANKPVVAVAVDDYSNPDFAKFKNSTDITHHDDSSINKPTLSSPPSNLKKSI